jgi:hypothetical protein
MCQRLSSIIYTDGCDLDGIRSKLAKGCQVAAQNDTEPRNIENRTSLTLQYTPKAIEYVTQIAAALDGIAEIIPPIMKVYKFSAPASAPLSF